MPLAFTQEDFLVFGKIIGLGTVVLNEDDQIDVMKGDFIGIDLSGGGAATIALVPERGRYLSYTNSPFSVLQ